jgi:CRP-like cAMP-binding protein
MSIEAFIPTFSNLEIFRGLDSHRLGRIVRVAERIVFKPGQPLIATGQEGDGAIVIIGGEAYVVPERPGDAAVAVREGSLLGESAMLVEHAYRITVVARTSVRALKLPRAVMHALMLADPALADHFVSRFSSRLSRVAIELRRIDEMLALAAETAGAPAPAF